MHHDAVCRRCMVFLPGVHTALYSWTSSWYPCVRGNWGEERPRPTPILSPTLPRDGDAKERNPNRGPSRQLPVPPWRLDALYVLDPRSTPCHHCITYVHRVPCPRDTVRAALPPCVAGDPVALPAGVGRFPAARRAFPLSLSTTSTCACAAETPDLTTHRPGQGWPTRSRTPSVTRDGPGRRAAARLESPTGDRAACVSRLHPPTRGGFRPAPGFARQYGRFCCFPRPAPAAPGCACGHQTKSCPPPCRCSARYGKSYVCRDITLAPSISG